MPATIDGVAGWSEGELMLAADTGVERVAFAEVTTTMFPLLGESPLLGTNFTAADARANNAVILSYGFWQERFGGAQDVLGKRISLSGTPRTIIGVMRRGFEFPTHEARLWIPFDVPAAYDPQSGGYHVRVFSGIARLKPGITPEQAAAEGTSRLNGVPLPDLRVMMPELFGANGAKVTAVRLLDWVVKDVKPALWILLVAGALLLAAAIGTVVNLQLAQATSRRREVAVRAAIGAGASRLARQVFVETTTVAAIGGTLGFILTLFLLRVLPMLSPSDFPRLQHVGVDARVFAVSAALTALVSLGIGLLPVRLAWRVMLTSALAEDGSAPIGQSLRSSTARSRSLVIMAQIAIAAVLLVGAALLSKTFTRLLDADRGYTPGNLMTARIGFMGAGLPAGSRAAFYRDVIERFKGMRGVAHVGLTNSLPLASRNWVIPVQVDLSVDKGPQVSTVYRIVTDDYFAAMGIRLVSGRSFNGHDTLSSEPVVVVNETFARWYLAGHPLGVQVRPDLYQYREDVHRWRIVGVVADVQHAKPTDPLQPELYATTGQLNGFPPQFLTMRTEGDPSALATDLRSIVRASSRNAVVDQVMTMEVRLRTSLARPRLYAVLIGGFSAFAVLIAAIGLFGGLSYSVTQRTREIGIRTALGATPRDIVILVVKQGFLMSLLGLLIGLAMAGVMGRYLTGFLFGIKPTDPATLTLVGTVLLLIALIACAIPAHRASKVDPMDALRR
jgi:putative ABC transport system permease protein